jgi:hypothetical protein
MSENMTISSLSSIFEVCAVSKALCSVSDGQYTESGEERGRHAIIMCLSHLKKKDTLL